MNLYTLTSQHNKDYKTFYKNSNPLLSEVLRLPGDHSESVQTSYIANDFIIIIINTKSIDEDKNKDKEESK